MSDAPTTMRKDSLHVPQTTHRDMGPGFTHHDGACGCQQDIVQWLREGAVEGHGIPECAVWASRLTEAADTITDLRKAREKWSQGLAKAMDDLTELQADADRLRDLLRGFRAHYGDPAWHDRVFEEIGPVRATD